MEILTFGENLGLKIIKSERCGTLEDRKQNVKTLLFYPPTAKMNIEGSHLNSKASKSLKNKEYKWNVANSLLFLVWHIEGKDFTSSLTTFFKS